MNIKHLASSLAFTFACQAAPIFVEGFDSVASLSGAEWVFSNRSTPAAGHTGWFQGEPSVATAQSGQVDSYIAANFNNVVNGGTIDNFLFTPQLTVPNGYFLSFFTLSPGGVEGYPDHLKVLWSSHGASTNVSDFTTVLLDINPTLSLSTSAVDGYPNVWTQFIVAAPSGSGRFAFEYQVPASGPMGPNGDYVGIDSLAVATPEPASVALVGSGILALAFLKRRKASRG